ncbi:MAG: insulinase family protein [Victivallales bacterium]|nr:insulinase family protein [Victivallales bacterium]
MLFKHACGLQLLSVECDDVENMFSAGFLTVPVDDTGVTHIIEHSVLGGSRRYPVRDPFMEMYKSSVATFINALTYHDYTIYPVSSTVSKDFFNLASVYFDAVFNPLLTPDTFLQEGWHYDFRKPGSLKSKLVCNGVVLNEMTGAFADVDEMIICETNRRLFPCSSRRFYSGGLPAKIPTLSYKRFKNYYKSHYHPSLAKLFLYGNIPTDEKLDFLERELSSLKVTPVRPISKKTVQPLWSSPVRRTLHYTPVMDENDGCSLAISFYLNSACDPVLDLAFEFLDNLLLDNESSPLYRAIMESGLCERLGLSGYDNETLETSFVVVANGVEQANLPKMEALILRALEECAENGFSEEHLASAFAQFKMEQSEITSSFVYNQMEKVYDAWFYGSDPFLYLDYADTIAELERRMKDRRWLPRLIRTYLCDNQHKLTMIFIPDKLSEKRQMARMETRLAKIKAKLSKEQLKDIETNAERFRNGQIGNSKEALATLPVLNLDDIPKEAFVIPRTASQLENGTRFVEVEQFTNGVAYLKLAFPLDAMNSLQLEHLLPDFISLFTKTGTRTHSYDQMAERLAGCGGSIVPLPMLWTDLVDGASSMAAFSIEVRALEEFFPKVLDILREFLQESILTETDFIRRRMKQLWAAARDGIMNHGTALLAARSFSGLSPHSILGEKWSGITALEAQRENAESFPRTWPKTKRVLEGILEELGSTVPRIATFNGSPESRKAALAFLASFQGRQGSFVLPDSLLPKAILHNGRKEKIIVSGDVSTCVRSFKAPCFGNPLSIPLNVYATLLDNGYAWDELRNNGGAYSAAITYKALPGAFVFSTSQDPSPVRSFHVFDSIPSLKLNLTQRELTNAILSTIKSNLSPVRPDVAFAHALLLEIHGITDELVNERFHKYLSLTQKEITEAVEQFWGGCPEHNDAAMGPAHEMKKLEGKTIRW